MALARARASSGRLQNATARIDDGLKQPRALVYPVIDGIALGQPLVPLGDIHHGRSDTEVEIGFAIHPIADRHGIDQAGGDPFAGRADDRCTGGHRYGPGASNRGDAVALDDDDRIRHRRSAIAVDQSPALDDEYLLLSLGMGGQSDRQRCRRDRGHAKQFCFQTVCFPHVLLLPFGCEQPVISQAVCMQAVRTFISPTAVQSAIEGVSRHVRPAVRQVCRKYEISDRRVLPYEAYARGDGRLPAQHVHPAPRSAPEYPRLAIASRTAKQSCSTNDESLEFAQ